MENSKRLEIILSQLEFWLSFLCTNSIPWHTEFTFLSLFFLGLYQIEGKFLSPGKHSGRGEEGREGAESL